MPTFKRLLDERLIYTGRLRFPAAWQKAFKKDWRACKTKLISNPDDDSYNPLPYTWACSCPAFAKSCFLICKHLVQAVHHVPNKFFNQVSRECTFPVWCHPGLRPLASPTAGDAQELVGSSAKVVFDGRGKREGSIEVEGDMSNEGFFEGFQGSEDGDLDDLDARDGGPESEAESEAEIRGRKDTLIAIAKEMQDITADITNIIDYNIQFADPRTVKFLCCQT